MAGGTKISYFNFYSRNIARFLEKIPVTSLYEYKTFNTLKNYSSRDCEFWKNTNLEFLSPIESLAVGISISRDKDNYSNGKIEEAQKFFEYSYAIGSADETNQEISFLSLLGLGIIQLEKALYAKKKEQMKYIRIANHYFKEAERAMPGQELTMLYRVIVMAAMGEVPTAVKYLSQASKNAKLSVPYFEVLEQIYKSLEMANVAKFYRNRIEKYRDIDRAVFESFMEMAA